ncbi:MAG TPA: YicC family protein [Paludibacteraceae bacterium]|nr:YicC/YloC family endoribonuclease [Porphyromonadaceae sp. NP-X]HNZ61403.1 YicC family protein [Paludibacteraceae bacterium]HOH55212.1 YicC family protein [Paludibacteraceae bacterium]
MIQSMTGFGKATCEYEGKKIVVEIKSLNSKQLDLSLKIAPAYRNKELDIRTEILQKLERGKIDVAIYIDNSGKDAAAQINQSAFLSYMQQVKTLSKNLELPEPTNWFDLLLRLPDVLKTENIELEENEWQALKEIIYKAVEQVVSFRIQEGKSLENVFLTKISNIGDLLEKVSPYETERIEKIRSRLEDNLQALSDKVNYDQNRLEQELIYYIEKLDINEEKVRLKNHLNYFLETMKLEPSPGKKLGFIAQEIGREINTLGAKANHSEIQKIVVKMKDELEQIKEQVLNVL